MDEKMRKTVASDSVILTNPDKPYHKKIQTFGRCFKYCTTVLVSDKKTFYTCSALGCSKETELYPKAWVFEVRGSLCLELYFCPE